MSRGDGRSDGKGLVIICPRGGAFVVHVSRCVRQALLRAGEGTSLGPTVLHLGPLDASRAWRAATFHAADLNFTCCMRQSCEAGLRYTVGYF